MLANSLRGFGYEVTMVSDGRKALELMRTGRFRLVVSDWEMPEMGGLELCRAIRGRQWSSYIYIILLTSYAGVEKVVQGLNSGADDFLTKPFHPEEIRVRLRTVERLLTLESRDITIFALAKLTESRDVETGAHAGQDGGNDIRDVLRPVGALRGNVLPQSVSPRGAGAGARPGAVPHPRPHRGRARG
jgi:putative two-component system response regulator